MTQDEINRRVYHARGVEREYERSTLNRAEAFTLLKYHDAFADRDVLDLGVGAGRTTVYLAPLARRYEAIDYSPVMVSAMRRRLPEVSTRLGDVRDLSGFTDDSFDFVLASNCVLDAVSHEDRLQALAEIRRVLRPGGVLMFSAHNRDVREALRTPRIVWSRNPVNSAMHIVQWLRQSRNRARLLQQHCEADEFALYTDGGHDYACLHYYIDQPGQRRQLERAGFATLDVFDHEGRPLQAHDIAPASGWLMYVAKAQTKNNVVGIMAVERGQAA